MLPGEIYLAMFPFGDAPGMKLRPVLTLSQPIGTIPEVLVAYISSVIPTTMLPTDLLLDPTRSDSKTLNLKTASVLHCTSWRQSTVAAWLADWDQFPRIYRPRYRLNFAHS